MDRGARYDAIQNGSKTYFSEKPCKRGHLSERHALTGSCIECVKINAKIRYHKNPKQTKIKTKEKYVKNAEKLKQKRKQYYQENIEKERELKKLASREWRKNNPGKRNALKAKYKADKLQATPSWVDLKDIESFYIEAQELSKLLGEWYHVDHIVPLRGKNVCGLHVPGNLQILTAIENLRKSNTFETRA